MISHVVIPEVVFIYREKYVQMSIQGSRPWFQNTKTNIYFISLIVASTLSILSVYNIVLNQEREYSHRKSPSTDRHRP